MCKQLFFRLAVGIAVAAEAILANCSAAHGQQIPRMGDTLNIPQAIQQDDVDWIRDQLRLSEPQEAAIRSVLDDYLVRWRVTLPDDRKALAEAWKQYEEARQSHEPVLEDRLIKVVRPADALRQALANLDQAFFEQIEMFLTQEQLKTMVRVRMWRQRTSMPPGQIEVHEAHVDLMELIRVDDGPADSEKYITLSKDEYQLLLPAIDTYEPMMIVARQACQRAARDFSLLNARQSDLYVRLHKANATLYSHPQAFSEREALAKQVGKGRLGPSRELARVNRFGVELFVAVLPAPKARRLEQLYHQTAYWTVYPDHSSVLPMYDAAMTLGSIDAQQREAIQTLRNDYERTHAQLSADMAEQQVLERELLLLRSDNYMFQRAETFKRIAELGIERESLGQRSCRVIVQMLNPEQMARLLLATWEPETAHFDSLQGTRAARDAVPQVVTAQLLRGFDSDVLRDSVLGHVRDLLNEDAVGPDERRARGLRLLTWDFRAVKMPRAWYSEAWIDRWNMMSNGDSSP